MSVVTADLRFDETYTFSSPKAHEYPGRQARVLPISPSPFTKEADASIHATRGVNGGSPIVIQVPSPSLFGRERRASYRFEAGEQYWDNETFKAKTIKVRPFALDLNSVPQDKAKSKKAEEKPFCRYCLEEETTSSEQLIAPCKCTGSSKYVHQECLKSWLLRKDCEKVISFCEVCKYRFHIDFQYRTKFHPCIDQNGNSHFLYVPLIIFLTLTLGTALFSYFLKDELEEPIIGSVITLVLLLFFVAICGGLSICAAHDVCFERKIIDWIIYDYVEEDTTSPSTS